MQQLQQFNFNNSQVRTIDINGETWFFASDVCNILEINNVSQALTRLDSDEKNTIILNEGIGNPNKSIVNESGLYSLVLSSRKKEANSFRKWITSVVLPTIRKTGRFEATDLTEFEQVLLHNTKREVQVQNSKDVNKALGDIFLKNLFLKCFWWALRNKEFDFFNI